MIGEEKTKVKTAFLDEINQQETISIEVQITGRDAADLTSPATCELFLSVTQRV